MAVRRRSGCDILIVDDDPLTRESLADLLTAFGYRVTSARHGLEALHTLRRSGPARLILCDLAMPVMNGWVFRSEQRRDPALAGIPLALLSGVHEVDREAESLGAVASLQKPLDPEHLFRLVAQHCPSRPAAC